MCYVCTAITINIMFYLFDPPILTRGDCLRIANFLSTFLLSVCITPAWLIGWGWLVDWWWLNPFTSTLHTSGFALFFLYIVSLYVVHGQHLTIQIHMNNCRYVRTKIRITFRFGFVFNKNLSVFVPIEMTFHYFCKLSF